MSNPKQILQGSRTILLVDWPNPGVPRALLEVGFKVYSFCPPNYSVAEVIADRPDDVDAARVFPPRHHGETGYLVFRTLAARPANVDLVNIYRPAEELPGIMTNHVLPLGAKTLWLQPPPPSSRPPCSA